MNHQGEVIFEHGGFRWRCQCGKQGVGVFATEGMAEKGHMGHYKRQVNN